MIERIPKGLLVGLALCTPLVLAYLAYSRPGYFTSQVYIEGLLLLEFLVLAIWTYRQTFFPIIVIAFLFAGTGAPGGEIWTTTRWLFLGVGAWVGFIVILKDRLHRFGLFHVIAGFAALAALISAAVSRYPSFALLKASSLLLLFAWGTTGARLAVAGRENRFFTGLMIGCEVFVAAIVILYALGLEVMGNPNSLGAVTGVVGAPMLLWGALLNEKPRVRQRRMVLFAACMFLVFHSHARAGIGAALVSCAILCLALRKYKLLAQGVAILVILITSVAIFRPESFSHYVSSVSSTVIYKGKDPALGFFASRESPWQSAIDSIRTHFWFGTGFGTTDNGQDASAHLNEFSTEGGVAAENGSSYLAILTWVGMLGVMPFFLMVMVLLAMILRTVAWMIRTGNPAHPAVPLAMVIISGLLHAGLEDWLFAPGYYLCVFFWSIAFILVDVVPSSPVPAISWMRIPAFPQRWNGAAPNR
jgi:O-antigen ligase